MHTKNKGKPKKNNKTQAYSTPCLGSPRIGTLLILTKKLAKVALERPIPMVTLTFIVIHMF